MKNNWILQADPENGDGLYKRDFDDYGFGDTHPVSIGDEIEVDDDAYYQSGTVVGIIRNAYGIPVCYKVICETDETYVFDYINPDKVAMCHPCGSADWSLARFGYRLIEDAEQNMTYYYNDATGDVIFW